MSVDPKGFKSYKNQGFSLMEMGMVLASAAAIIAVVVGAAGLLKKTRMARIIEDVNVIFQAVDNFEDTYKAKPGDIADVGQFPAMLPAPVAGNGNGKIDNGEVLHFWRHLSMSGLLPGTYDGVNAVPGQGVPRGSVESSGFSVYVTQPGDGMARQALVVEFSGYASSGGYGILAVGEAQSIDKNLDDGSPSSGLLRAVDGSGVTAGSCVDNGNYASTDSKELTCVLRFVQSGFASGANASNISCGNLGETRISPNVACPQGFSRRLQPGTANTNLVGMVQTCGADGNWGIVENFCTQLTCSGGDAYGAMRTKNCPPGYVGTITDQCSNQGVWLESSNSCALDLGPCSIEGAERLVGCLPGDTGSVTLECVNGNWSVASNNCGAITCGADELGDTRVGEGAGAAACDSQSGFSGSYVGDVTEMCSADGTWKPNSHECRPVYGTCSYPESDSGVGVNKRDIGCPPGETGAHIQTCVDASNPDPDYWKMESDSCKPVLCGDDNIGELRDVADPSCGEGIVGKVVEICDVDGVWKEDRSLCVDQCSGTLLDGNIDTTGNATWPNAAPDTTVYGTCLDGNVGLATRKCAADGVWADLKTDADYIAYTGCGVPKGYPGSGLRLHLSSIDNDTVLTSGSTLTSWLDRSGRNNHFTVVGGDPSTATYAARPEITRQVVRFDGDDWLQSGATGVPNLELNPDNAYSIFAVALHSYAGGLYQAVISSRDTLPPASSVGYVLYRHPYEHTFASQEDWVFWGYANQPVPVRSRGWTKPTINEMHLISMIASSNSFLLYQNGVLGDNMFVGVSAPDVPSGNKEHPVRVGAGNNDSATPAHYLNGDIAELMLYNRVVSNSERDRIHTFLAARWGITLQIEDCPVANANCQLWLDADDPRNRGSSQATSIKWADNGSSHTYWTDKTGKNHDAIISTSNNAPIYVWNVLNGKPVVRFDGVDDYMGCYERVLTTAGDDTYTISAVWTSHLPNEWQTIWEQNPSTYTFGGRAGMNTDNTNNYGFGALGTAFYVAPYSLSAFQVSIVTLNNGAGKIYHNGTEYTSAYNNTTANLAVDRMTIAASIHDMSSPRFYGDIAEIMVFDKTLSPAEVDTLEAYYGVKWGITIN